MYRDMNPELNALESGLERFIRLDKGDFIGRDAVLTYKERNDRRRSVTLRIDTDGASTLANEGLYSDGKLVGRITSGGYGYALGHDVALALLPERFATPGTKLDVAILGEWKVAEVVPDSPYDPTSARARM
jgi:dimethylglycine dehydrogenase